MFFPPVRSELGAWFGTTGKWETSIKPTFTAAVAHMKEHKGAEDVGCAGFCWGGMIVMKAAALGAEAEGGVKLAANAHAAMLSVELAEEVSAVHRQDQGVEGDREGRKSQGLLLLRAGRHGRH